MEIAIIVIIVALAVFAVAYNLYRTFAKRDGCACSGGGTCPSNPKDHAADPCAPCQGCQHDGHSPPPATPPQNPPSSTPHDTDTP